ncbi:MarR family transcriptional regulator [Mycolicibacter minnesotensis]|uniref:MarR family transcriptional regulator n=1 Tax=Mycolicibacter minnesotensis TaxID=1118379 RepID=A0A7I7R2Z8_9MYCO|nr:MarR family transcriptional regulator [Mycolicibacter minnesotensis]ORA99366.1 MarR family transcriptional regulator [Mycolicibacter minnesotensis]BBY33024.1 MarR family transcriptional regulator [Mycolicibacter minnesotensis]
MTNTPEADLSRNLLWLLKQAFYYSLTTVNEAIGHHGVSSAQIALLRQLADEPGLSGAQLARRLLITPQGAQLAVSALERRGLVERTRDPRHGRILRAYLTEEGRAVTAVVVTDALDAHDEVFGVLSSDEQEALRGLLTRFVDHHNGRPQP